MGTQSVHVLGIGLAIGLVVGVAAPRSASASCDAILASQHCPYGTLEVAEPGYSQCALDADICDPNGIATWGPSGVQCNPTTYVCGDGICYLPEITGEGGVQICDYDCNQSVCDVADDDRCSAGDVETCSLLGVWEPLRPCPDGTECVFVSGEVTCATDAPPIIEDYGITSPGDSLLWWPDADRDGWGDPNGVAVPSAGNKAPNDLDCDDDDPNVGPDCQPTQPLPTREAPEYDPAPPHQYGDPQVRTVTGCDPEEEYCCDPDEGQTVTDVGGTCVVECVRDPALCPCGATFAADTLVCTPCAQTCGDGVCDPEALPTPEDGLSCPIDCAVECYEGEARCFGDALDVCESGAWERQSCGDICREVQGVGECATCDEESPPTWWADVDRDGYGDPDSQTFIGCRPVQGYVDNALDSLDSVYGVPPFAVVEPEDGVFECEDPAITVALDGSDSYDLDGSIASYLWTNDDGLGVVLCDTDTPVSEGGYPEGTHFTYLTVTDDDGLTGTVKAVVNVLDTLAPDTSPAATCPSGTTAGCPLTDTAECGPGSTDVTAWACDLCDGTAVSDTASVDTSAPGTFGAEFSFSDSGGRTATLTCPQVVQVQDTTEPEVTLAGDAVITRPCSALGQPLDDPGASAQDVCEGDIPIDVTATFDPTLAGTQEVVYQATDSSGNTGSEILTVEQAGYDVEGFGDPLGPVVTGDTPPPDVPRSTRRIHAQGVLPLKVTQICEGAAVSASDAESAGLPPVRLASVERLPDDGSDLESVVIDDPGLANDDGSDFRGTGTGWQYNLSTKGLLPGLYILTVRLSDGTLWRGAVYLD